MTLQSMTQCPCQKLTIFWLNWENQTCTQPQICAKAIMPYNLMRRVRSIVLSYSPTQNCKWKVMPFGLKTAGTTYTRLLEMVLKGAQNLGNFIDDVIGHSDGFESHLKVLKYLFSRTRAANLKIKPSKTKFCYTEVNFLGHVVSQGRTRPMTETVERILDAPVPETNKDMRFF